MSLYYRTRQPFGDSITEASRKQIAAIQARARARGAGGGLMGLGDVSLVARAVLDPMITHLEQLRSDLANTWHPTGFYTPAQVRLIVQRLLDAQHSVINILDGYLADPTTPGKWNAQILLTTLLKVNGPLNGYLQQAALAEATQKKYIDAPGFRDAVVQAYSTLVTDTKGLRGLLSADSFWSDLERMVASVAQAFTTAGRVINAITGVAIQVVEAAAGAVMKVPDTIGFLAKLLPFALVIGGGAYAYMRWGKGMKKGGGMP